MKVTCIKCKKTLVAMGAYYEENFRGKEEEYVCFSCRPEARKLPLPSDPVAILLCGDKIEETG